VRIYKYTLELEDWQTLTLPKGARVLSFHEQHGQPRVWVLVDPNVQETEERRFRLAGTGHPIDRADLRFVGTALLRNQTLVLHLFVEVWV
jgi:hypothetical protein